MLRQQEARSKVDEVPPGVDAEVWRQMPVDSRAWAVGADAVGRTPTPCRRASEPVAGRVSGKPAPEPRTPGPGTGAAPSSRDEVLRDQAPPSRGRGRPRKRPLSPAPEGRPQDVAAAAPSEGEPQHCVICLTQPKSHAFVPCGHQCACSDCATAVAKGGRAAKCPICRARVQMVVRIFS